MSDFGREWERQPSLLASCVTLDRLFTFLSLSFLHWETWPARLVSQSPGSLGGGVSRVRDARELPVQTGRCLSPSLSHEEVVEGPFAPVVTAGGVGPVSLLVSLPRGGAEHRHSVPSENAENPQAVGNKSSIEGAEVEGPRTWTQECQECDCRGLGRGVAGTRFYCGARPPEFLLEPHPLARFPFLCNFSSSPQQALEKG